VQRNRPPSPQTISVLRALAVAPARWRYGYDLGTETGLKAGSVYPILVRLADRGLLEATWEEGAPPGRPPRHLYRLTPQGRALAAATAATNTAPVARSQRRRIGQPQQGSA
jgi:PadR family transcriptional regulator, regulatory protein PadR